jgi:hypothetical protein
MPRKPVTPRLIGEHGVVNFHASVIPPSYLFSDFYSRTWVGHRNARAPASCQRPSKDIIKMLYRSPPSRPGPGSR